MAWRLREHVVRGEIDNRIPQTDVLHQALTAAEALDDKTPFPNERIVHYQ
jgi:hypothetical protein